MNKKIFVGASEYLATEVKLPKASLLIISADAGFLACGYINIETANKFGVKAAIVSGVNDFDDMLKANIKYLSESAKELGLSESATGADFLKALASA